MHKFTKYFIAVAAVIALCLIGWYALSSYGFDHPKTSIIFETVGEGDENTFTVPTFTLEPASSWGVSEEWDTRYFEVYDVTGEIIDFCKSHSEQKPFFFDTTAYNTETETVFEVSGYYTDNGERVDVTEKFPVGFIASENIEEH